MKVKFILVCVVSIVVGSGIALSNSVISNGNWINHSKIKEVREIVNDIEAKIKNKQLVEKRKSFEYSQPYVPTLKVIYFDKNNKARKYIEEAGSDDSSVTCNYYYDNRQILRFVFITGAAVNGSILEHRIYFDANGEKIWELQTYTKGPGYTFPKEWPKEQLIMDPIKRFYEEQ